MIPVKHKMYMQFSPCLYITTIAGVAGTIIKSATPEKMEKVELEIYI